MKNDDELILIKLIQNLLLLNSENRIKIYYLSEAMRNKKFDINNVKELSELIKKFLENKESEWVNIWTIQIYTMKIFN